MILELKVILNIALFILYFLFSSVAILVLQDYKWPNKYFYIITIIIIIIRLP